MGEKLTLLSTKCFDRGFSSSTLAEAGSSITVTNSCPTKVWVVSPDKTLHRHLFDLVLTGGDSSSTNMRDYFDNFANVLRQYARLFRQFKH